MAVQKETKKHAQVIGVIHDYHEQAWIYCGCAGAGKPTILSEPKPEEVAGVLDFDDLLEEYVSLPVSAPRTKPDWEKDYYENGQQLFCPTCKTKSTLMLSARHDYASSALLEYVKLYDNDEKVSLSVGMGEYIFTAGKIAYKQTKGRYTFNSKTGFTYFVTRGKVRNITYLAQSPYDQLWDAIKYSHDAHHGELVTEFQELCKEKRGLRFVNPELLPNYEAEKALRLLLKFPVLENFPTYEFGTIEQKQRKALKTAASLSDVYEAMTGHGTKSIRKLVSTSPFLLKRLYTWGPLFKDSSNVQTLLRASQDEAVYRGQQYGSRDMLNTPESRDRKDALQFLIDETAGGSELVFLRRVTRYTDVVQTDENGKAFDRPFWNEPADYEERTIVNLSAFEYLAVDIKRMYEQLKSAYPEYELDYRGDYKAMHDIMVVESRRLHFRNLEINYTKEQQKYNRVIGGLEFRLAETTERLSDMGRKMTLCVGGYRDEALRGGTTIVSLYQDDYYLVCIEIKSGQVVQAKTAYNHYPNPEISAIIRKWAKELNLKISTEDLNRSSYGEGQPESIESIKRKADALEVILDTSVREVTGELAQQDDNRAFAQEIVDYNRQPQPPMAPVYPHAPAVQPAPVQAIPGPPMYHPAPPQFVHPAPMYQAPAQWQQQAAAAPVFMEDLNDDDLPFGPF